MLHAFLKKNCAKNTLSYGYNHYSTKCINSIHAEHHAILNLPYNKRQSKLVNINILVIRVSKTNKLGMSKPCSKCVDNMINLPSKKGYKIKDVYYSDSEGQIIKTTLKKLKEN